jgi:16S rRNA (cytosine1402-N4)-methyltransferase
MKPIETTFDLVEVIGLAVPVAYKRGRTHFATKTFQAVRMAVNDELRTLEVFLNKSFEYLSTTGRLAIITFHSLEDRQVKRFFKEKEKQGLAKIITKKPITPSDEEVLINRRSRSAKLRILEKI